MGTRKGLTKLVCIANLFHGQNRIQLASHPRPRPHRPRTRAAGHPHGAGLGRRGGLPLPPAGHGPEQGQPLEPHPEAGGGGLPRNGEGLPGAHSRDQFPDHRRWAAGPEDLPQADAGAAARGGQTMSDIDFQKLETFTQDYADFDSRKSGLATALGGVMALIMTLHVFSHSMRLLLGPWWRLQAVLIFLMPLLWLPLKQLLFHLLYRSMGPVKA